MLSPVKIWRNQNKIAALIGRTGKIISWTIVRVPSTGFKSQAPYPVVLVELDQGSRRVLQLVDWNNEQLIPGQQVVSVVRRLEDLDQDGVIPYGIKAKLKEVDQT